MSDGDNNDSDDDSIFCGSVDDVPSIAVVIAERYVIRRLLLLDTHVDATITDDNGVATNAETTTSPSL